jgi:hypothetical protein
MRLQSSTRLSNLYMPNSYIVTLSQALQRKVRDDYADSLVEEALDVGDVDSARIRLL